MRDRVEYQEHLSIRVGSALLSKGFGLASCTGLAKRELDQGAWLGILCEDAEAKPRRYLFGLITRKPRRIFLGIVWFDERRLGASEEKWVFEVYGRRRVGLAEQLANELALTFGVHITVLLTREEPDVETYLSDYD